MPKENKNLMTAKRFVAIVIIFVTAGLAWGVLGGTIEYRTAQLDETLSKEVDGLWGPSSPVQEAPMVVSAGRPLASARGPSGSDIRVSFVHHHRYKGLLWFSTYRVRFEATYIVKTPEPKRSDDDGPIQFVFPLPTRVNTLENLTIKVDGQEREARTSQAPPEMVMTDLTPDGGRHRVTVSYETRGRDRWTYRPNRPLKKFNLVAFTNFTDIDYPKGSVSPINPARRVKGGMAARWKYDNVWMTRPMGIEMPKRANAGPVAARMSFFAPVSLFFFFTVLFTVVVLRKIRLHPMHYLFVSAGFFVFHILLAYLVDKISIHLAFWICAGVSVALTVSYMRLVAGMKFALFTVGIAQLVYLVGFSYAFFWVGWTGLAVVIAAILTLFVLMQATGRVDWFEVFGRPDPFTPPPPCGHPPLATAPAGPGNGPAHFPPVDDRPGERED